MLKTKTKRIIAITLILGQLSSPAFSFAQLGLGGITDNSVPTADKEVRKALEPVTAGGKTKGLGGIIPGDVGDIIEDASDVIGNILGLSCKTTEVTKILEAANNVGSWTFGGIGFLTGDAGESLMLKSQITVLTKAKKCIEDQITELKKSGIKSVQQGQIRQSLLDELTKDKETTTLKLDSLNAQYRNAQRGLWKTLMIKVLVTTSKAIATSLTNKLVNKYKINNLKQYADSVATLMYDNQFLRDNFPKNDEQLMARAILNNPMFRNRVHPGIFVAADAALGFDPDMLDPKDPDFYNKMAKVGSRVANPYYQNSLYVGGVDQARASSLAVAQGQISQSNGYKAPVNCAGSIAQQDQIDIQSKSAAERLENRSRLFYDLKSAKAAGKPVKDADLKEAERDYLAALNAWNDLPATVTGSNNDLGLAKEGGGTQGKIAINICEGIASPASLVNKGIDAAFNHATKYMSDFNDNNLPLFTNLIGDIAADIGTSLIFGGGQGAKAAFLINEDRLVSGAVAAGTEALYNNAQENLGKGIDFSARKISETEYTLSWQIIDEKLLEQASFVTLEGDGIPMSTDADTGQSVVRRFKPSDSLTISPTTGGDYILFLFDSNGRIITATGKANINLGEVAGAFTDSPVINTRGPLPSMSLRGQ